MDYLAVCALRCGSFGRLALQFAGARGVALDGNTKLRGFCRRLFCGLLCLAVSLPSGNVVWLREDIYLLVYSKLSRHLRHHCPTSVPVTASRPLLLERNNINSWQSIHKASIHNSIPQFDKPPKLNARPLLVQKELATSLPFQELFSLPSKDLETKCLIERLVGHDKSIQEDKTAETFRKRDYVGTGADADLFLVDEVGDVG